MSTDQYENNVLKVLSALARCSMCRDQISQAIGMPIQSVCPAMKKMLNRNWAKETDKFAFTRMGARARVCAITAMGKSILRDRLTT